MHTPAEALREILRRVPAGGGEEPVPLAAAGGRRLAREVLSDVDVPPFEKSMMDGYAVRAADLAGADALPVAGEARAGAPLRGAVPAGACVAIYTGAPLPPECDAVVMVERTERGGDRVRFHGPAPRAGANVSHRGEILGAGRPAVRPPRRLSPADLAVLAAVGCDPVPCRPRPRVAVLTTGDELVPVTATPGEGQIREGNTVYLRAACEREGCEVVRCGIVPDEPAALERAFRAALDEADALVTTGGVSVGRYDLVGAALEAIGVEPVLHKVAIKPGKPIWFGVAPGGKPVLGLPGNPVSSLLGFEVFVRPALARLAGAGEEEQGERLRTGRWAGGELAGGDRQLNLPVAARRGEDGVDRLEPVPWKGSADVVAVAAADGLAVVEPGARVAPGALLPWRPLGRA